MKFALDTIFKKISFVFLIISLIFLGTQQTVDFPEAIDKIINHYITKIVFLLILSVISNKSLPMGIVFAIIFIMLTERIVDKEIEKVVEETTEKSTN